VNLDECNCPSHADELAAAKSQVNPPQHLVQLLIILFLEPTKGNQSVVSHRALKHHHKFVTELQQTKNNKEKEEKSKQTTSQAE
jgi:hypothetical protein